MKKTKENLEGFHYDERTKKYFKINKETGEIDRSNTYYDKGNCPACGDPFIGVKGAKVCSKYCRTKKDFHLHKISEDKLPQPLITIPSNLSNVLDKEIDNYQIEVYNFMYQFFISQAIKAVTNLKKTEKWETNFKSVVLNLSNNLNNFILS